MARPRKLFALVAKAGWPPQSAGMTPSFAEGLLALILALPLPVWAFVQARRAGALSDAEFASQRMGNYRGSLVFLWATGTLILALWLWRGRSLADLGLGWPEGPRPWAALGLALGAAACLGWQARMVRSSPAAQKRVLAQLAHQRGVARILPGTEAERRLFRWLALSAGICEEVIWRGFLYWIFALVLGPLAGALLALAAFVAGHLYQDNLRALAGVALIGLILTLLVRAGGTLYPAMLLHAAIDLASAESAWAARRAQAAPSVN
jgi:hypothetical protein